jgi:two-component system CheB/CheR fusion protein
LIAHDGAYEVRKEVRSLVVFGEHDLGYRAPFPRIDLVLCRNVLIYFTSELQRRALQLFAFSLRQGGYLALGKAETVSPFPEFFTVEQPRLKVFRRVGDAAPIPAASLFNVSPFVTPAPRQGRRSSASRHASPPVVDSPGREPSANLLATRLMDRLSTGIVTIDRHYHIRSINTAGRRLLGIHTAAVGEDVIHRVAPALAGPLRGVLDLALSGEGSNVSYHVPDYLADGDERDLMISAYPIGLAGSLSDEVVLEVVEITTLARAQRESSVELDGLRSASERERERAQKAAAEVRSLRTANETMASEVTKLQAENEELLVANEEAQAAAEEIETLNEELQATNEELETLNEELQATVEELAATNDELQARTVESLEIAAAREADRQRLEAVLGALGDAVLLVDSAGEPVLSNSAYDRAFGDATKFMPEANVGERLPESTWPQRRAARGESFTESFTMKSDDGSRRWFEANGQPFLLNGAQEGGVVAIRDVTDRSLRRLQEQFLAIAGHELRTPLTALSLSLDLAARKIAALNDLPLKRDIDRALEQTRRLSALAAELADVGRLQLGAIQLERQPLDLVALTSRVIDSVQAVDKGQQIQFDGSSEPAYVSADPRRIEQVLLNVLVNAMTFTSGNGSIDVDVRQAGDVAELTIRDHGPGIRADALPFIFDRFYRIDDRTPSEGLGLGLFIARQIVDAHGGEITVISPPGDGATFTVRLPLLDASSEDGEQDVSSRGQRE